MTRINLVPPSELHQKHLQGEYFELPRVFTNVRKAIASGKTPSDFSHVDSYRLGPGHVIFFYTRLGFLVDRFGKLVLEMIDRGNRPTKISVFDDSIPYEWYGNYIPTEDAIDLSRSRLIERVNQMTVKELEKKSKASD